MALTTTVVPFVTQPRLVEITFAVFCSTNDELDENYITKGRVRHMVEKIGI